jgi:hypothetical protein
MLDTLKCILCLALIAVASAAIITLRTVNTVVAALPAQLTAEAANTRADMNYEIAGAVTVAVGTVNIQANALRQAAVHEIRAAREDIAGELGTAALALDRRAAKTAMDSLIVLDHHAKEFEDRIDDTNVILLGVAKPARSALVQLSEAEPDLLDHEKQIVDNWAKSAGALNTALPKLTVEAENLTTHEAAAPAPRSRIARQLQHSRSAVARCSIGALALSLPQTVRHRRELIVSLKCQDRPFAKRLQIFIISSSAPIGRTTRTPAPTAGFSSRIRRATNQAARKDRTSSQSHLSSAILAK